MARVTLQIEDWAGRYAVGPIPPQPEYTRSTGVFDSHKAALRFAKSLSIVRGWRIKDLSEAGR
jgi:hypothetical protein